MWLPRLVFLSVCFLVEALATAESPPTAAWDSNTCETKPLDSVIEAVKASPTRKRVLVTGAAGFIASHVADVAARRLGFDVIAVDDLSGGFMRNIPDGVKFVNCDLQDTAAVEQLFSDHGPFEYIYHLAAYAAEGLSHFIRGFNYRNNLLASVSLINQAVLSGCKCFIFTSSIAVSAGGSPLLTIPGHPTATAWPARLTVYGLPATVLWLAQVPPDDRGDSAAS
jgi:hypothetical protein